MHNILMPFLAVDDVLTFLKSIDASCGIWWIWSSVGWMHGWGLAGFVPVRGAAWLASWPLDHDVTLLKMKNEFLLETH